jgi:predicted cation transporter
MEPTMVQTWPAIALVAAVLVMALGLTTGVLSVSSAAVALAAVGASWLVWWVRQPIVAAEERGVPHAG